MRRLMVAAFLVCGCARLHARTEPASITTASQAAFRSDYKAARALFEQVAAQTKDPKERETAELALADIEWRIDGRDDAARARLEALGTCRALLAESRLERERFRYGEAEALARRAQPLAKTKEETAGANRVLSAAIVEAHVKARLAGAPPPPSDLREAFRLAQTLVEPTPGRLRPSLLYLDAALMLGEGEAALAAWKSYFGAAARSALLAPVGQELTRSLSSWRGGSSKEIAAALAASRLFDEAVLLGAEPDVIAWDKYIHRVREVTDAYYREIARGGGDAHAYRRDLAKLTDGVCSELKATCKDVLDGGLDSPLYARFGALIAAGKTGGTFNLHFGHAVADDAREVAQYGHTSRLRFVLLDGMVSDGFESWSWDYRAQHGGWGHVGFIVQVRPAYAEGPIQAWEALDDPDQRKRGDDEIARESQADWGRAAADPYGYLPGLRLRLVRGAGLRLLDELRARGLSDPELRDTFLVEWDRRCTESSIFAHEGRHAIDLERRPEWVTWLHGGSSQTEFQAKLSEIAFAPDPKLALTGGILVTNIGAKTPHGLANQRITKGLVEWMTAHSKEIAGLEPSRPMLPQLDLLTDDQLRSIARGMDPLAK